MGVQVPGTLDTHTRVYHARKPACTPQLCWFSLRGHEAQDLRQAPWSVEYGPLWLPALKLAEGRALVPASCSWRATKEAGAPGPLLPPRARRVARDTTGWLRDMASLVLGRPYCRLPGAGLG